MCDDTTNPGPTQWLGKLGDLFTNVDYQLGIIGAREAENGDTLRDLVKALDKAIFVRNRPADRFTTGYLASVPTTAPVQIIGRNIARAAIAIKNLSTNASDVVWVAPDQASARSNSGAAFPIYGGSSWVLDTVAEVWVFAYAGSAPAIGWVSTEYNEGRP